MASINASSGANMKRVLPVDEGPKTPLWGILDCREVQSEKIMFQKETFQYSSLPETMLNNKDLFVILGMFYYRTCIVRVIYCPKLLETLPKVVCCRNLLTAQ